MIAGFYILSTFYIIERVLLLVEFDLFIFTVILFIEPMKELGVSLALSHKHEQIKELESEMREEGFWNDPDKAQEVTRKVKNL